MTANPDDPGRIAGVLADVAEAVAEALAETVDWGESGQRDGQYLSDLDADAAATRVLTAAGYGVLSEESGRHHADREITVVVDPLDGSTNASRRLGWWATSLCAVDRHGPLVSLVVDLRHGDRWTATRGGGAFRNGEAIRTSGCRDLSAAIVGLNGVPSGHGGWAQYRALGAAALDLCAVADGSLDGYLDCTTDELGVWDYLGAALVCVEAGGVISDATGRDLVVLEHGARRIPVAGATSEMGNALGRLHPTAERIVRGDQ
ncbi:MAG: inositol monophosphatase [Aquihabitans sp.]